MTETQTKKNMPLLVGGIVGLVVLLLIIFGIAESNHLQREYQAVQSQYAQVDIVLQRRADLVPNLTSAVKGSMRNDQKIFGEVARARSNFNNAKTASDRFKASQDLERSTNVLVNAIKENYPQLNSTKRVHDLMIELEGTENRISTERQNYNRVVQQYNT